MDPYLVSVLSNIGLFSFLALSAWILLLGGEISFGQQAYFAIGAYAAGIASAVWAWPFTAAVLWGAVLGAGIGALIAWPAARFTGVHYAIATLAFAELTRAALNVFHYQRDVDGYLTGPDGANGFGDIRWVYEAGIEPGPYLAVIATLLLAVIALIGLAARLDVMAQLRMVGEDPILAAMQGVRVLRWKIGAAAAAGGLAGLGGGLYAHFATYVEPAQFSVMTGVHAVAYGLIGGLGTALGPILGVLIDIGLLESLRALAAYRMIVFGGLVAIILILRPRGLLDETLVAKVRAWARR
ncbi:amino acid/amide ABC transporter membrane protein 2, HAAT family [Roseivivax lentus]|uniref:Amino acid/amide ABC transporter membrane protein 2, HAAT family n=1 Tax=Roseivivax lentus TaxID=633194 RepID=A0A1N7PCH1_9RHOB|nr:branched-chain amino acid ABC transporter permease [Roseivivax lentus]SIT08230.1 amino acid/amide ABC transporter membrane protein 2, HAAT family [Roseivivax lentus]